MLERYGQVAMSRLDKSQLLAVRKVSDVLPVSLVVSHLISLVLKMRFPPSVCRVEARVTHSDAPGRS